MSASTSIQWTDKSWNPVRGCSVVSPGCHSCYAMKLAHRFSGGWAAGLTKQTKAGPQWTGKVVTVEDALREPLSWRKPQRVFVNSMSDLFHEDVPDEFIDRVFAVMALASRHTFQVLTKRASRMQSYMASPGLAQRVAVEMCHTPGWDRVPAIDDFGNVTWRMDASQRTIPAGLSRWPLPNVWLGVSVEDQQRADERIPLLLQTPAAVRFISAEPLLGQLDLSRWLNITWTYSAGGGDIPPRPKIDGGWWSDLGVMPHDGPHLDWIIAGGESGPGARPCALEWLESLVEQCRATDGRTKCFIKQLGAYVVAEARTAPADCWPSTPPPKAPNGEHWAWRMGTVDRKGGDITEFPERLRIREFPESREVRVTT